MNKHDDFMKKVIITMAVFLLIFTIVMIGMFWIRGDVPDTLIGAVFAACIGEGSICGLLKKEKINNDADYPDMDDDADDEEE